MYALESGWRLRRRKENERPRNFEKVSRAHDKYVHPKGVTAFELAKKKSSLYRKENHARTTYSKRIETYKVDSSLYKERYAERRNKEIIKYPTSRHLSLGSLKFTYNPFGRGQSDDGRLPDGFSEFSRNPSGQYLFVSCTKGARSKRASAKNNTRREFHMCTSKQTTFVRFGVFFFPPRVRFYFSVA